MENNKKIHKKNLKVKFVSGILIAMILVTNTFSLNLIKVNATEQSHIDNQKIKKKIKTNLHIINMPKELKDNLEMDTTRIKDIDSVDAFDLHSLTTISKDNIRKLYIFDNPIKYYDSENNEVKFIDNTLVKSNEKSKKGEKYAYENSANDIKVYIPKTNKESVCIENAFAQRIEFSPITDKIKNVKIKNEEFQNEIERVAEYEDVFESGYSLQYIPQSDGVKENIIINKNNGIYTFDFILKIEGLHPNTSKGKSIELVDNDSGKVVFTLGEIFMKDSYKGFDIGNKHISFDNYYIIEKHSNNEYKVKYILDKKFLKKSDTIYPVIVDPSISPIKKISDAPVYNGKPKENFKTNAWLEIGKVGGDYGVGYGYFQTSSISKYKYINSNNITRASLKLYEGSGTSYSSNISAYDTNGTWSDGSLTWNNRPGKSGSPVDTVKVTSSGFYNFNITPLVKKWLKNELGEGGSTYKKGVILAPSSSENKRKDFCSSNYGTASKRPSITIEYKEDETIKNNTYFVENYNSGMNLAASSYNVFQYTKTYMEKQQWIVKNVGDGYYTIANKYYGNTGYLNVANVSSDNNADIWDEGSGNAIKYKIVKNNDGSESYRIMSKQLDDLMALKVKNGSINASANVDFEDFVGKNASKWKFSAASSRYTLPDVYVRNIESISKIITPLSQYQFNIKISDKYSKIGMTKTKVEILDDNSNIVFNTIINTDSIYGGDENIVSFKWKPEKEGTYTIKVVANYDNSVKEYDFSNNSKNIKVKVVKGYYLKFDHALDHGFVTLLGNGDEKKAINLVSKVTNWVAQYYKDYQGIIIDNNIGVFTSLSDECKYEIMSRTGENRSFEQLLNTACPFDTKAHKPSCTIQFTPLLNYIFKKQENDGYPVVWTGHKLFVDTEGINEWNRSYRLSNPKGICMITGYHTKDFLEYSTGTLLHEIAHVFGARDHYDERDSNNVCRNKEICSVCGVYPRSKECVMFSVSNIFSIDKNKMFCKECIEDIKQKMEGDK